MTITSREALPSSQLKSAWMAHITKALSGLIGIGLSCVSKNCWFKDSWKLVPFYLITNTGVTNIHKKILHDKELRKNHGKIM